MKASIALLLLGLGISEPQQAPPAGTRAAEAHALREAKARRLEQPKDSRVERILFKVEDDLLIERWLNPPRGIYLRVGGIGEGAGFGLGPGYRYTTGRFDFRISAAATMRKYVIGEASVVLPGAIKDGLFVELYARRRDFPQEDFFGIGPGSLEEKRSNFALRDTLGRVTAGARKAQFSGGVGMGYLDPSIGSGTDTRMPSTDTVFSPVSVPGLDEQPSFTVVEPFVEFSTVDPPLNPVSGVKLRYSFSRYGDRDLSRYSFRRNDLDVRAYLPLLQRTHSIALRTWIADNRPDSGEEVPFYFQPTLGGSYSLRGFRTFRFRDRSLALVQAEYRWRINEFVTGAVFYDSGGVGPELGELGRFEKDYGFGLRAGGRNGVAFRTDIAFGSGEGTRILVRFNHVF